MFSQSVEYALRAVVWMASRPGAPHTTQEIAEATQTPAIYLYKVLQALGRSGLVKSQRGLHGGYILARSPDQMTLLEVINAIDPVCRITTCPLGLHADSHGLCPLHQRLDDTIASVEKTLAGTTIREMIDVSHLPGSLCETAQAAAQRAHPARTSSAGPRTERTRGGRSLDLGTLLRDHKVTLGLAQRMIRAAAAGPAARRYAVYAFVREWDDRIREHLAREERLLTDGMRPDHLRRLIQDHARLREMADAVSRHADGDPPDALWIRDVATSLRDHIRWEERELFPAVRGGAPGTSS